MKTTFYQLNLPRGNEQKTELVYLSFKMAARAQYNLTRTFRILIKKTYCAYT